MVDHGSQYSERGAPVGPPAEDGGEPTLDGPGDPVVVDARLGAGQRLDRFLASTLADVSRTRLQRWIALGAVTVDGASVLPRRLLRGPERIEVRPLPREADRSFAPDPVPLVIVHEDADLMVVDKPAGLVTHPAPGHWRGTLMNGLLHRHPDAAALPRAGIVHRLDKDTSGLMMVARSEPAYERLVASLAARRVSRRYLAAVEGRVPPRFDVDAPIGRDPRDRLRMAVVASGLGKPALTRVERLAVSTGESLIECRLETGRTHQIRVHLAHRGHPLVGDLTYGGRARDGFARQALHAWRLGVEHPRSGVPLRFASGVPPDLAALLDRLGLPVPEAAES
jgi:23S rRNA pseudouridine1911/1915/1917 synthase